MLMPRRMGMIVLTVVMRSAVVLTSASIVSIIDLGHPGGVGSGST